MNPSPLLPPPLTLDIDFIPLSVIFFTHPLNATSHYSPQYQLQRQMLQHAAAQRPPWFLHISLHCNSIDTLKKLHAVLVASGLIRRQSAVIHVAGNYIGLGNSEIALSVLDAVERPTLSFQNLAIRCLSDHGLHGELLDLYSRQQRSRRFLSDNFTFPLVFKACAALSCTRAGQEVHSVVLRTGYGGHVVVQTALLDMYSKFGRIDLSEKVFDGMPERDLVSWNAMMSAYCSNGLQCEAFRALWQMRVDGFTPCLSTFATILPLCKSSGMPPVGKSMHGLALKCGAFREVSFVVPIFISMYAGFEDLASARMLFESLNLKDVVAWNAMISAYVHNGKWDKALETFQLMQRMDEQPNSLTLIPVLASCSNLIGICHGESVHAFGIKLGIANQDSVVAALVSMYAKLGETDAAQYLFNGVEEKRLLLWNCMISGYNLNRYFCMSLNTFRDMQLGGVGPDDISLASTIAACTLAEDLLGGKSVHAYSIRNGFDADMKVTNALLSFYSECDQFSTSLKLFNAMQVKDVISWNTIIKGFAKVGDASSSVASFCVMRREGVLFDIVTMISVISSFWQMGERACGMFFHAICIKTGCDSDVALVNVLINTYAGFDDIEAANILFDGLSYKTIVTWNSLMSGYRKKNMFKEIFIIFDQMKMEGQKPNSVTLLNILPACESQLQGKSAHAYALKNIVSLEPTLARAAMMMYGRFSNLNYCYMMFEMVDKNHVIAWNTMMSIYIQTKHEREAVVSFSKMLQMDQEPDHVTMLCLASASSHLGSTDLAHCVMGFAIRRGFGKYTSVSNSILDMFARCGSLSTAEKMFDGMEKDSITWGIMINGYGMHGDGKAALSLFAQMQEAGMRADDTVFLNVLSACSHSGLIEEGRQMFKMMTENYGIMPRMEHYACMVDLFGRAGKLEEAYDIVKSLPFEPSPGLLESILGACKSYHSNAIGEAVGNLLVELRPLDPCSYVMLSNIYAGAERWMEYDRVRCDMELRGVKKDAGISIVEIK